MKKIILFIIFILKGYIKLLLLNFYLVKSKTVKVLII